MWFLMVALASVGLIVLGMPVLGIVLLLGSLLVLIMDAKGRGGSVLILIALLAIVLYVSVQIGGLPWEAF